MKTHKTHTHGGFTLVELLVVIVIIATLVAISSTMVIRFRKSADKTVVLGNLRQLQTANISYSTDNQGKFVPIEETIESVTYPWFNNPGLISQLKGEQATYTTSGGAPNTELPSSLMDPVVTKAMSANYQNLSGSYSYVRPSVEKTIRMSQLQDASRSAAFITASGDGLVDIKTTAEIKYRHSDKAVVVYYGGHAAMISEANINSFAADDAFWEATE